MTLQHWVVLLQIRWAELDAWAFNSWDVRPSCEV